MNEAAITPVPAPMNATVIGLLVLGAGLALLLGGWRQWRVLANICIMVGAPMTGGGIVTAFQGSLLPLLALAFAVGLRQVNGRMREGA